MTRGVAIGLIFGAALAIVDWLFGRPYTIALAFAPLVLVAALAVFGLVTVPTVETSAPEQPPEEPAR